MTAITTPTTVFIESEAQIFLDSPAQPRVELAEIPVGIYKVSFNPKVGFYLEKTGIQEMPAKTYGNVQENANMFLNTFKSRGRNTGVLLNGVKGTGKSLLLRQTCINALQVEKIPVLLIETNYAGADFNTFMGKIKQRCVVAVDEFEKIYADQADQERLLSLLDGTGAENKLWIISINNANRINEHMLNRPGRLFYKITYETLPENVVIDVCKDKGLSELRTDKLLSILQSFALLTFDVLLAIIEESKRYDICPTAAIARMNVDMHYTSKRVLNPRVELFINGELVAVDMVADFNQSEDFALTLNNTPKGKELLKKVAPWMVSFNGVFEDTFGENSEDVTEGNFDKAFTKITTDDYYDVNDIFCKVVKFNGRKGIIEAVMNPEYITNKNFGAAPMPEIKFVVTPQPVVAKRGVWDYV